MGADVDGDIAGAEEPAQLINRRLRRRRRRGSRVEPPRDVHPTLAGKVVWLDDEPVRPRPGFEPEEVEELLGVHPGN